MQWLERIANCEFGADLANGVDLRGEPLRFIEKIDLASLVRDVCFRKCQLNLQAILTMFI